MILSSVHFFILGMAAIPLIYYALALFSAWQCFRTSSKIRPLAGFTPPVSNLKPVRGLDPDAYENFASYCRQDYPQYELLFCVHDQNDPAVAVLEKLAADFPHVDIRILYGSEREAINDKVA